MKLAEHVRTTVNIDILRIDNTVWHYIQLAVDAKASSEVHNLLYSQTRDISVLVGVMHFMSQYEYR